MVSALQLQNGAYLAAPNNAAYNFGTGNFTLEAWVKPAGAGTIISCKGTEGGPGSGGFLLVIKPDGSLKLATDNGFGYFEVVSATTAVLDGQWHHIAGVRDGPNLYLYLDCNLLTGTPQGNATPPLDVTNGLRMLCGATDQAQEPYNALTGLLAEVRVWNIARSQAELAANMNRPLEGNEPGLVAYWRLDGNGNDASPTNNSTTQVGTSTYVSTGPPIIQPTVVALWPTTLNQPANTGRSSFAGPGQITNTQPMSIDGNMRGGPVVDAAGNIYVGSDNAKLYCLSPNGSIKWSYTSSYPFYPTPAIGPDGTIYGCSDQVVALTPAGSLKWTYTRRDFGMVITVPPKLNSSGDSLYVVAGSATGQGSRIIALNTATGQAKWEMRFSAGSLSVPGIGADGTVYVGSEELKLYALDPSNGSVKWAHQETGDNLIRGPVAIDSQGTIYFCKSGQAPGENAIVALNSDGSVKWSYRAGGYLANPPSIAIAPDGTIYVGFYGMVALTPEGKLKWSSSTAGNVGIYPGAAAVDQYGAVYFGTGDGKVFGYSPTGTQLWRLDQGKGAAGPAITANGLIYFSDAGSLVYAVSGPAIEPPTQAPTLQAVAYSGAALSGEWSVVSQPGVNGYTLAVFEGPNVLKSIDTADVNGSLTVALTPGISYTAQVRALNSLGMPGPWSTPVEIIITAPTVSHVSYAGSTVTASWTAVSQAGVSGYVMGVSDGAMTTYKPVSGTSGSIDINPDPTKSYTLRVQATGDHSTGPWSAPVEIIVGAPTVTQASYDGSAVSAVWTAVNQPGVSGYVMRVSDGVVSTDQAVSGTSGSLSIALDPAKTYTLVVYATGSDNSGPLSAPVEVIVGAPTLTQVSYDGSSVSASWVALTEAAVSGYTMRVSDGVSGTDATVSGTSGSITMAIDPARSYTVRVQGIGGVFSGPWSAPVSVIARVPTQVDLFYNGVALVFSWAEVADATVSGYTTRLLKNSQPVENRSIAQPPVTFAEQLQFGARYQAQVRATGASTEGPWSVLADGPSTNAVVYTYDELVRLRQTVIDGTTTVTYVYDDSGNITTATLTRANPNSNA